MVIDNIKITIKCDKKIATEKIKRFNKDTNKMEEKNEDRFCTNVLRTVCDDIKLDGQTDDKIKALLNASEWTFKNKKNYCPEHK